MSIVGSRLSIWWLGLGLLVLLSGCGPAASRAELPGIYVADYDFATDTLVIKADGRFTQTVTLRATGKVVTASGAWSFDLQDHYIGLDGMLVVSDYANKLVPDFDKRRDYLVHEPVERWFGRLQIGSDPGVPYYRQAGAIPR